MSIRKLVFGVIRSMLLFVAMLFLPAGTLAWPRAWAFLAVVLVGTVASVVSLYRANRELLRERFKAPIQKGQPAADKILVLVFIAGYVGQIVFIPLDVFRFHLLAEPPMIVSVLGLMLFLVGWWIVHLVLLENAFASPAVRLQEERQHRLVDTGVYRVVRHPMYAGMIPMLVGMSLWLGSYAAALAVIVPIGLLAIRILIEERFLRRELPGYDEYPRRVRYRMIPGVW